MTVQGHPPRGDGAGDGTPLATAFADIVDRLEGGEVQAALRALRDTTDAAACAAYRLVGADGALEMVDTTAPGPAVAASARHAAAAALRTGTPIWAVDEAAAGATDEETTRSVLACPVLAADGQAGAVVLAFDGFHDGGAAGELARLVSDETANAFADVPRQPEPATSSDASVELLRLGSALAFARTPARAAQALARKGQALLGATSALVFAVEGDKLVLRAASGVSGPALQPLRRLPVAAPSPFAEAVRYGRPVYLPTRSMAARLFPEAPPPAALGETIAVVPLATGERMLGVLAVGFEHVRALDPELLLLVSRHASQALARLALGAERDDAIAFERRFQRVTAGLSAAATPDEVMRIAISDSLAAFGASAGVIATVDRHAGGLRVRGVEGPVAAALIGQEELVTGSHPLSEAFDADAAILLTSPEAIAGRYPELVERQRVDLRSLAALPLASGSTRLGALLLLFSGRRPFTEYEQAALRRLSERTADALARSGLLVAEQAARRRSDVLHGIAALLNTRSDARGVARALLSRLTAATGATDAAVAITEGNDLQVVAITGHRTALLTHGETVLGWRAILAGTVLTGDATPAGAMHVAAPLATAGGASGVVIATLADRSVMSPDALDFYATVGRMAGAALDRALASERDHRVAKGLQEGLLGRARAPTPNLITSAGYRAGEAGMNVGGDWYDVVPLPDGRVLLTVGDVVGHGLEAAAVMGQLRSAVATLGPVVEGPGRLLDELSSFADSVEAARYASVAVAILDPDTGELTHAAAGHLPPLLLDGAGARYLWSGRSEPLACRGHGRPEARALLEAGATLVLFTDGLVERRSEILDEGLGRLRREAARLAADAPDDLADRILDALLAGIVRHDDAVVLAATIRSVRARVFHHELALDPAALVGMRRSVRSWLRELGTDETTAEELVLVLNEAAANAVEHGAGHDGRPVHVRLAYDPRTASFDGSIVGAGRWLARPQDDQSRGHGLGIIRSLTDEVVLERRGGTALRFRRSDREPEPSGS